MPLWKVYHPVGAFTAEDKKGLAERITSVYASVPIPKFYAVIIFRRFRRAPASWEVKPTTSSCASGLIKSRGRFLARSSENGG